VRELLLLRLELNSTQLNCGVGTFASDDESMKKKQVLGLKESVVRSRV
jgi:hypothetical protein